MRPIAQEEIARQLGKYYHFPNIQYEPVVTFQTEFIIRRFFMHHRGCFNATIQVLWGVLGVHLGHSMPEALPDGNGRVLCCLDLLTPLEPFCVLADLK